MNMQRLSDTFRISFCEKYYSTSTKLYNSQRLTDFPVKFLSKDVEQERYNIWERNKYFTSKKTDKEFFNMILPPPNITGILHLGHALTATIQDVLARWHRMKGHPVMWIPGLDHAGIATQAVVEKYLYRTKNLTKLDVGKEEFISLIWQWKNEKEYTIKNQLKALGASLDWDREYFTIDKHHSAAVTETFITLNERNMLYRAKDLVNWSPAMRSTISEIEVENTEITGKTRLEVPGYKRKVTFGQLVKLAYPIEDSKEELLIMTTRPETVFGDVAVAIHPDDDRYSRFIGQNVFHPIRKTVIPIIADSSVKRDFGTGIVKVTPAHDRWDYTIAKKHNLQIINVIDENGNMTDACEEFKGLPRFIAREKLMDELTKRGILRDIYDHKMLLPRCSRSQDIIEYLLKEQWFVKCDEMAKKALDAVKMGSLKITPSIHEQLWYDWLTNVRDWCISRQLWWGHRIPAYCVTNKDVTTWIIARSEKDARLMAEMKYGNDVEICQDSDVLDTWFSSAIIPFVIFGWPKSTQDMAKYYPLTLMETGHDILVFWVAKMVMLGLELTQSLPFKEVLLHGVLCDANGKKMSKSSGNVISPENIINGCTIEDLNAQAKHNYKMGILNTDELKRTLKVNAKSFPEGIPDCGADALRMSLCGRNIKNQTVTFDVADCRTNKYFCNKIWQASRYTLLVANDDEHDRDIKTLTTLDQWILSRLSLMVEQVNEAFDEREFHKAVASIKQFFYYEFCDFYLEGTKIGFKSEKQNVIASHSYTLKKCLETSLRITSPIIPFLSDDLYTRLAKKLSGFLPVSSLLEAPYPMPNEFKCWRDIFLEQNMQKVNELINAIRRCMANITKKSNPEVNIITDNSHDYDLYNDNVNLIKGVTRIWNVPIHLINNYKTKDNGIHYIHTNNCSLFIMAMDISVLEQIRKNIMRKQLQDEGSREIS